MSTPTLACVLLVRVTSVLATLPATANPSCAIHVHVGMHGGWQLEPLRALLQLFAM